MTATLLVLPRFPHAHSGTGQRSRLLIEGAQAAGPVHVVLVDGADQAPSPDAIPGVASITTLFSPRLTPRGPVARRLGGGLRLLAPGMSYAPDPALKAALSALIRQHRIDTVIFRYAATFCAAGLTAGEGLRVLVDVDDRDDQKYQTRLTRLLGSRLSGAGLSQAPLRRLAGLLQARLSQASHVWFAAQDDIWPLEPATVSLLPNVVYGGPETPLPPPSASDQTLLFVGIFNHLPNRDGVIWFLQHCWPRIVAQCPAARLRIVGRGNWAALADHQIPPDPQVQFVGEVTALGPEYAAARLAICPVREGGGSKIKVIEAASYGRPVVASPHSLRGFENLPEAAMAQAADPADFAAACIAMLSDPGLADHRGHALQRWQRAHYARQSFTRAVDRQVAVAA